MDFLTTGFNVLLIILGFGLLIAVHELGHFIAAKWAGIRTEAFAIGMGPVAISWRKGIGVRLGSTARYYETRVRAHLDSLRESDIQFKEKVSGAIPQAEMYRIGDKIGLGETEYSLRWLPIGGFVKMLGQEDANPNSVSDDPRSYSRCPVGKRMIVVSAGVIMNILLALVLFIVAFMVGVRLDAPTVGVVAENLAAGQTKAENADRLGVTEIGLQPADEVLLIDGKSARTFADLQIASAMGKPNVPVRLSVKRAGVPEPLEFSLVPQKDANTGLLSIGVGPGKSTTLWRKDEQNVISEMFQETGLDQAGVQFGMRLVRANGRDIQTYEQYEREVELADGKPVMTEWSHVDDDGNAVGDIIAAPIPSEPVFQILRYADAMPAPVPNFERGLFGMVPLTKISRVMPGDNEGILQGGDVVLRAGAIDGPLMADIFQEVIRHTGKEINLTVLRDGLAKDVTAYVNRKGKLNIGLSPAWETPMLARPMEIIGGEPDGGDKNLTSRPAPAAELNLFPRTYVLAVGELPVTNWPDIRRALRRLSAQAFAEGDAATIALTTVPPTPGADQETSQLSFSADEVRSLHALSWTTALHSDVFTPIQTTLTADGNPFTAIAMGFAETKKLVLMTYLTIDRLFRGTMGVDQLRGPVGIVHIGSKVADRGFMYIIFFLGMISVNLAVINFLPMPIVDGGLFLFLIYEKFKGRPPSLAFQNAATIVGLCLIGTLFIVTFYNDVLRLIS